MHLSLRNLFICLLTFCLPVYSVCAEPKTYKPSKVIYDVSTSQADSLSHILDRVSLLQNMYGSDPFEASIIIIVHEGAVPLFAKAKNHAQPDLMRRARSLTMGEIIQFRICHASARMQGFVKSDFYDFVAMVPMADAEIIQLQQEGYAYLR
jgi:intracellular sulfur oxidation DsrE/DsrF family protein